MLVKGIMSNVVAIDKDIYLGEASEIMEKKQIGSLVVMKGNKIIGIVTEDDLVGSFGEKKKVSEVMSKDVVFVQEESTVDRAIGIMKRNKVGVLPVLNKKEELVGIISAKDLLDKPGGDEEFLFN